MSDYPKAGWNGEVIPGGWDSRHARPAGEVASDDLDDLDALLAEAERRGAERALREAANEGPLHFAATHTGRDARGWNVVEADWLRARADEIGGTR